MKITPFEGIFRVKINPFEGIFRVLSSHSVLNAGYTYEKSREVIALLMPEVIVDRCIGAFKHQTPLGSYRQASAGTSAPYGVPSMRGLDISSFKSMRSIRHSLRRLVMR